MDLIAVLTKAVQELAAAGTILKTKKTWCRAEKKR
jgi:hypothetical protein